MNRSFIFTLVALACCRPSHADEPTIIDAMESLPVRLPEEKVKAQVVEGKVGRAVKIDFSENCQNVFVQLQASGTPEWDKAAGFSFWVKGDGSDHLGGIEMIWDGNYSLRYAFAFPIDSTEWRKVTVRWGDLVPETANSAALPIDTVEGNAPSKLGQIWFGKWWYWRDYAAHYYTIDQIQLESAIDAGEPDLRPVGDPMARVKAKLVRKEPVKIVLMGDSLTDLHHWANREQNWPAMLEAKVIATYGARPTIINTAMGGTELRQNLVLIPRWSQKHRDADLVIVCFGGNDWSSGMRGRMFEQSNRDAIERIRRATGGGADVLLCTTCPSCERWQTMAELSEACRDAAKAENAGVADIDAAFHAAGKTLPERERLFASDKTHLGPAGHQLFAETIFEKLTNDAIAE
jgi:lysophospholipase L1-like esterase